MDLKDLIMLQMTQQGAHASDAGIYAMLLPVMVIFITMIIDFCKENFERIVDVYAKRFNVEIAMETITRTPTVLDSSVLKNETHEITEVLFTRVYSESSLEMNEICDAILHKVCSLHNIPKMQLAHNGKFITTYRDKAIQISESLFFKIHSTTTDQKDQYKLESIKFSIFGKNTNIPGLNRWVQCVCHEYKQIIQNELDSSVYYFEYKSPPFTRQYSDINGNVEEARKREIENAPKNLTFDKQEFVSNKNFNSLFGSSAKRVYKQVKFFTENEKWYKDKGLPYHLGMLFHGIPGCGKTACIKAIAKYTNRHLVSINFRYIKTMTQFKNLFYSTDLYVLQDENTRKIFVPQCKRLYVLEEIDAISEIVKKRAEPNVVVECITKPNDDANVPDRDKSRLGVMKKESVQGIEDSSIHTKPDDRTPETKFKPAQDDQFTSFPPQTKSLARHLCEKYKYLLPKMKLSVDYPDKVSLHGDGYYLDAKMAESDIKKMLLVSAEKQAESSGSLNVGCNPDSALERNKLPQTPPPPKKPVEIDDELTLGGILQLIDGTQEVNGRIMIITSNFPETIDKALLRPGRIDLNVQFGKCDKECIKEMYENFFNEPPPNEFYDLCVSPAEMQQILLERMNC